MPKWLTSAILVVRRHRKSKLLQNDIETLCQFLKTIHSHQNAQSLTIMAVGQFHTQQFIIGTRRLDATHRIVTTGRATTDSQRVCVQFDGIASV